MRSVSPVCLGSIRVSKAKVNLILTLLGTVMACAREHKDVLAWDRKY